MCRKGMVCVKFQDFIKRDISVHFTIYEDDVMLIFVNEGFIEIGTQGEKEKEL